MRIATWNLERPSGRRLSRGERISKVMESVAADIWVLTETVENVRPHGMTQGFWSATPERIGHSTERWVAIWTRYTDVVQLDVSDPIRSAAVRVRRNGRRDLVIFGTVLPWIGSAWQGISAKEGAAFQAAVETQAADWCRFARLKDADLVVAGDLNQDFNDRHYYGSKRNRHILSAALDRAGLRVASGYPHDPVRAHAPSRASIDHICVPETGSHWKRTSPLSWPQTPAPDPSLSDHFGLALDVDDH